MKYLFFFVMTIIHACSLIGAGVPENVSQVVVIENSKKLSHFLNYFLNLKSHDNIRTLLRKRVVKIGAGFFVVSPVTLFTIMFVLRYFPHKKPMRISQLTHSLYFGKTGVKSKIIFINGFNDNGERLSYAIKKSLDQDVNTNIYAPIFSDARNNRLFDVSWGQIYDCLQLVDFFKSIDFVKDESIVGVVCHSLGGARFLTFYDLLKNKNPDFLRQADLSDDEAGKMFEKLRGLKKCPVAPLLDLKEVLMFHMKRWYIPFSGTLSSLVCRYCMPFITGGKFDPYFQSPKQRLQAWTQKEDFENFHFFYPERDDMVGNAGVQWLCNKMNVVENAETTNLTNKSIRVLSSDKCDKNEKEHEGSKLLQMSAAFAQRKQIKNKIVLY